MMAQRTASAAGSGRPFLSVRPRLASRPVQHARGAVAVAYSLQDAPLIPVMKDGEMSPFSNESAVYAVYDKDGTVQYVGLSRKVSLQSLVTSN